MNHARGVRRDFDRLFALARTLCERHFPAGCWDLALLPVGPDLTPAELERVDQSLRRLMPACEAGDLVACERVVRGGGSTHGEAALDVARAAEIA